MQFQTSRVLACALLATPVLAANDDGAQAWLGLDQEISNLSTSLTTQGSSANVGGLIRSTWTSVDEEILGDDIEGFLLLDADLWVEGGEGDYSWRISADLDGDTSGAFLGSPDIANVLQLLGVSGGLGGSALLEDAYASWNVSDEISIVWGSFKAPTSLSNQVDPENLVMIRRTIAGRALEDWQLGAMVKGNMDQFSGSLAIQNGNDGVEDEYRITARGEFHINGGVGGGSGRLGAHGSETDDLAATVGLSFRDDETASLTGGSDSTIFVLDGAATFSQFGVHGEFVNLDDDIGDGDIIALTGSMAISDSLEAAIRYQQTDLFDGLSEIDTITAGIAYIQEGARWAINISDIDDGDLDGVVIEVGLTVGQSRG